jgi:hypothetical protein
VDTEHAPVRRLKLRQNSLRNKIVRMRNRGDAIKAISKAVGLTCRGVEFHLTTARRAGLLVDATEMMDVFAMPKAVDAYLDALDSDNLELRVNVATKVMNGRGVLKSHNKQESTSQSVTSLTIHIDQPTDRDTKDIEAIMGEVVGVPRQMEAPKTEPEPI